MKVINNRNVTFWDVDETLVMHTTYGEVEADCAHVLDPITGQQIRVRLNLNMLRLLTEEKSQGSFIVVWSRGGHAWAEAVVKALGLEDTVDLIMTKPMVYFDDKPVEEWLPYRVYLAPDVPYKNGGK